MSRLAAVCCAVWSTGEALWAGSTSSASKASSDGASSAWRAAMAGADVLWASWLLAQLRRQLAPLSDCALAPAAAAACAGLARQTLRRWRPLLEEHEDVLALDAPTPSEARKERKKGGFFFLFSN